MRRVTHYVAAALLLSGVYGCGGGGAPGALPSTQITSPQNPAPAPAPSHGAHATSTPVPTPTPVAVAASSRIPSTIGRIGLIQSFDYTGGGTSWISADARKYDAVWASVYPSAWSSAHPGMLVSYYFILGLDRGPVTHHDLAWFQANHPDWVLYACKPNGTPTHDVAYMPGIPHDEVPLDLHNGAATQFELSLMAEQAAYNGYNAIAIDQAVFWNTFGHGKDFGCGVWQNGRFVRRYANANDRQFAADVVSYVQTARDIAHSRRLALAVNHPAGSLGDPLERTLVQSVDLELDETGFSDYGNYARQTGLFARTLAYLTWVQRQHVAVATLNRYSRPMNREDMEYVLAGYLMSNEGAELVFADQDHRYNYEAYHPEYDAAAHIGRPCGEPSAGPVFTRRYSNGLVLLNDSRSSTTVSLPSNGYQDLEGRAVRNPLRLDPSDAYVLLGASC